MLGTISEFYVTFALDEYSKPHFDIAMKKKLLAVLTAKCKSFGLTPKGIETLVEIGVADLADDATDDDIAAKADSLVPYAKAMQGEITRKTRKSSTTPSDDEGDGEENNGTGDEEPAWMKKYNERLEALETENETLKKQKAAGERAAQIAAVAKKHGIPDFMVKHLNIAEDADIETEVAAFKQELVNHSLVPKGQAHEPGNDTAAAKESAKAWAASLPDNSMA